MGEFDATRHIQRRCSSRVGSIPWFLWPDILCKFERLRFNTEGTEKNRESYTTAGESPALPIL